MHLKKIKNNNNNQITVRYTLGTNTRSNYLFEITTKFFLRSEQK